MENGTTERAKAPWHLWVVGILGLLWFSGGGYDYFQTKTLNMEYLGIAADSMNVPVATVVDYFDNFPLWANVCWAFGVWGAIAGAILLLLRSKFALHGLILSLLGLAGSTLYTFALSDIPPEFETPGHLVFSALIWLSVAGMAFYAKAMISKGVLR